MILNLRDFRISPTFFAIVAVIIAANAYVVWSLVDTGQAGFIRSPIFKDGLVEIVAVSALAYFILVRNLNVGVLLLFALICVFARRNNVDLPLFLALAYFEGLLALGLVAQNIFNVRSGLHLSDGFGICLGIMFWLFGALVISLFGFGAVHHLQVYSVVILVAAVLYTRSTPLSVRCMRGYISSRGVPRVLATVILAAFLIRLGSAGRLQYCGDCYWYLTRLPWLLIGENSLFDKLGYVAAVHYYPKLYELLIVPLFGLGLEKTFKVFALLLGFGAVLTGALAVNGFSRSRVASLITAALLASLPVLTAGAIGKSDILACLYGVAASIALLKYAEDGDHSRLPVILAFLGLAGIVKMTNAPYAAILFALSIVVAVMHRERLSALQKRDLVRPLPVLFAAVAVAILALYRNAHLVGAPILAPGGESPSFLYDLFKLVGWDFGYPLSDNPWRRPTYEYSGFGERLSVLWSVHFSPQSYDGHWKRWLGILSPFLWVSVLWLIISRWRETVASNKMLIAILVVLSFGIVAWFLLLENARFVGNDSYYFMLPITVIVIFGALLLYSVADNKKTVILLLSLFVPVQLLFSLMGSQGTFAGTHSFNEQGYFANPFASWAPSRRIERDFRFAKASEFVDRLNHQPFSCTGVYLWEDRARDHKPLRQLPCGMEDFRFICGKTFGNPALCASPEAFAEYLTWAERMLVIVPTALETGDYMPPLSKNLLASLDRIEICRKVEIGSYRYHVLSTEKYPCSTYGK